MLDSIGKPEILDGALALAALLFGAAGFWRGIAKEALITGALVIGQLLALAWETRWSAWLVRNTDLGLDAATFTIFAASVIGSAILFGYIGAWVAGFPPADLPGRLGGLALGLTNAALIYAFLLPVARIRLLSISQERIVAQTRLARQIADNPDWIMLFAVGIGLILMGTCLSVRRRRAAILPAGAVRPGASGFQVRRAQPLAPEAEKIDPGARLSPAAYAAWSSATPFSDTVALNRVSDPSLERDRPNGQPGSQSGHYDSPRQPEETVRCISCGERITESDRFCPRCGRLLVH